MKLKIKKKGAEEEDDDEENPMGMRLEVIRRPSGGRSGASGSWGSNPFEPRRELSDPTPTSSSRRVSHAATVDAPEKKLTLFALRLAIIEKLASGLGQLAFIWATVVLLGGFASDLKPKDFWFVTTILVVEGARLFSRSHELEWQHRSTRTLPTVDASRRFVISLLSFPARLLRSVLRPISTAAEPGRRLAKDLQQFHALTAPKRRWHTAEVPILPYTGWVFISKNISRLWYWLQIFAAIACVAMSLLRLGQQDFDEGGGANEKSALNVFYSLALAEAVMFLLEKGYWSWRIEWGKLVERVCYDCDLDAIGMVSLRRFFYDAYSKCVNGSVFDCLKMDLVTFAEDLLDSDSRDEQLIGATILRSFVNSERFAGDTLRKIGSSTEVIERLTEMLNWKDPTEEQIRRAAAEILSKLASKKQHALRVAAIPGAMESIASLLYAGGGSTAGKPYEASPKAVVIDREDYEFSAFNLLGLLILKRLARDHDNCWKIGNTRGLLARIIDLTAASATQLRDQLAPPSRVKTVQRALHVVLILVSTTGGTGKILRREVSEIVYAVSNVRDLLQYGESHLKLQKLGVEILTSLAMDEEAREKIGATGGVLRLLLGVFFRPRVTEEIDGVCNEAGEALAMLMLESRTNCERLLREGDDVVRQLVDALHDTVLRVNAGRILRGLCAYSPPELSHRLRIVADAMPTLLKTIMEEKEKEKLLETSIGLALHILRLSNPKEPKDELRSAGFTDQQLAAKVVEILKRYDSPDSKVPRIRRFAIGLVTNLMKYDERYVKLFRDLGMEEALRRTAETTSELECFNVFSGTVGLCRYEVALSSLWGKTKPKSKKKEAEEEDNDEENPMDKRLEVICRSNGGSIGARRGCGFTPFEPQSETMPRNSSRRVSDAATVDAPEKRLTLFAIRLAIIEKLASGLGQLAFIWATVVLLGGFASDLKPKDFWFVTTILVVEGARLFSRSHEIKWQQLSTRTLPTVDASRRFVISLVSFPGSFLRAVISPISTAADSRLLYWLQIFAAIACVAMSLLRLGQQDFAEGGGANEKSAVNVFYGLSLAVAVMFLLEKGYWSWKIEFGKLVERVCYDCRLDAELDAIGMVSLRRFFYDAYSKCVHGSVFDCLKMDLVTFAKELLDSDSPNEQLIGATILRRFVKSDRFAGDTLRKIGSSTEVIERLMEMLNWKDPTEEQIRRAAAEILSKLASKKQHALRVAAIPGAMESIASLLYTGGGSTAGKPYKGSGKAVVFDIEDWEFSAFNLLGLLILKRLARDHDNCWKIGNTRGLLALIIDLTAASATELRDQLAPPSRVKTVRRALHVVLILVSATGGTGKMLRREVSKNVYAAGRILRGLCAYSPPELSHRLRIVADAMPTVRTPLPPNYNFIQQFA
ncbi:hypothetical protein HPP92_001022 [Vanilla planifolia]|uniref:Uncharacterized protein n=1 Tax=Vanilla planifolia TaxID=51239 RepID=A0A835VH68_VANPL|nr:hypothetical protein HPP92_001022 [Vanilla planifolia]